MRETDPVILLLARQERADRERERHGHPDVAEVQQRWMHRHERMVLEQRIGPRPIGRHRRHDPERIRRSDEQEIEERPDAQQRGRRVGHERAFAVPVQVHHERAVHRQHEPPEQDRALERAPERDDRVEERRRAAPHLRHVADAEVVRDERVHHSERRQREQPEGGVHGGVRSLDELAPARASADEAHHAAEDRDAERHGDGARA